MDAIAFLAPLVRGVPRYAPEGGGRPEEEAPEQGVNGWPAMRCMARVPDEGRVGELRLVSYVQCKNEAEPMSNYCLAHATDVVVRKRRAIDGIAWVVVSALFALASSAIVLAMSVYAVCR